MTTLSLMPLQILCNHSDHSNNSDNSDNPSTMSGLPGELTLTVPSANSVSPLKIPACVLEKVRAGSCFKLFLIDCSDSVKWFIGRIAVGVINAVEQGLLDNGRGVFTGWTNGTEPPPEGKKKVNYKNSIWTLPLCLLMHGPL